MKNRSALASIALGVALLSGCGDDPVPTGAAVCAPACRSGFTCVAGACVSACNPPCGPSQSCVMTASGAACEGPMPADVSDERVDATNDLAVTDAPPADVSPDADDATAPDVAADQAPPLDAPAADAPPLDAPPLDAPPLDAPPLDAPLVDIAPDVAAIDVSLVDVSLVDVSPVDEASTDAGPRDAAVTDTAVADVPTADASSDAADAGRRTCGDTGQACCQNHVCAGANVCDTTAMRCVAYTPIAGECTSTLRCTGGEVCGGIYLCGARPCLLCVMPGPAPLGAACTNPDQCASDLCFNGVCTAPCLVGSTGDDACAAMSARMICGQFTSQAIADGGAAPVSTFGGCLTACARNADCATGLVCRLQRNDFEDRLDAVCSRPSGAIAPGAACDPNPPAGATAAMFCDNGQCLGATDHAGSCAPFCATDADCPSSAFACVSFIFGRPSGAPQPIRMCARR